MLTLLVLSHLVLSPIQDEEETPHSRDMIQLLENVQRIRDPLKDPYVGQARLDLLRKKKPPEKLGENFAFQMQLADEALRAGRTQAAIVHWSRLRKIALESRRPYPQSAFLALARQLAVAHLRLSEEENCLCNAGGDSCLFPIRESGRHTVPRGAKRAIGELTALLNRNPGDLSAMWLLNVASMAVGSHPEGVDEKWRLPVSLFESKDTSIKPFPNIATPTGSDILGLSGGVAVDDFDGDGFYDIIASSWGLGDQVRFLSGGGDGTFEDVTEAAGLIGIVGGLNLCHADYDNDGWLDVFILRGAWRGKAGNLPNSLLKNMGNGRFVDVTHETGLLSFIPSQTATWADFNNDGRLDLFIGNESDAEVTHPCQLFMNQADGTFVDQAEKANVNVVAFVKGVTAGDFDNDRLTDLYLSTMSSENRLLKNTGVNEDGIPVFEDVTEIAQVKAPMQSFPTWFWDYNNDGHLDILAASYDSRHAEKAEEIVAAHYLGAPHSAELTRLHRNNGDGTFTEVSKDAGLDIPFFAMGSNFGDINGDGFLDCYLGTGTPQFGAIFPNRMFVGRDDSTFDDVTTAGGFGHLQKGHGVAFADFDHDGDQDVYAVLGGAYPADVFHNALFANPGHGKNWIYLRLVGTKSNRFGVGCRIQATVTGDSGPRHIHRVVGTGGSFGCSPTRVEMYLGSAKELSKLDIYWPATDHRQSFEGLTLKRFYEITEFGGCEERPLTRVELAGDG